jgi:hypothetical protein
MLAGISGRRAEWRHWGGQPFAQWLKPVVFTPGDVVFEACEVALTQEMFVSGSSIWVRFCAANLTVPSGRAA